MECLLGIVLEGLGGEEGDPILLPDHTCCGWSQAGVKAGQEQTNPVSGVSGACHKQNKVNSPAKEGSSA